MVNFKFKAKRGFLSIIIPVYNDPHGLRVTIRSLMDQSLNKSNYEVIVANDGADDKVTEVCKLFDIKAVALKARKGSYGARNKALNYAKGEFILFLDANIKIPRSFLEKGCKLLKKYDYVGGRVIIDPRKLESLAHYFEYLSGFKNEKYLRKNKYLPTANLFVKRKIIESLGGFDERLNSGGDVEFGNRVYDSQKFRMHYSEKLFVIHPPRGHKNLVKKYLRTLNGAQDLVQLYPDRFSRLKLGAKNILKASISPIFNVIASDRVIDTRIRIILLIWALFYGIIIFHINLNVYRERK